MGYTALLTRFTNFSPLSKPLEYSSIPEHTHSLSLQEGIKQYSLPLIPEHTHSMAKIKLLINNLFRSIPIHFYSFCVYFCVYSINDKLHATDMAGKIIDMSKIKQVLLLHLKQLSNRRIAKELCIDKGTINDYINKAKSDSLGIAGLLDLDDPILEGRFFCGNPAYSDGRMVDFLDKLPYFKEQLGIRHVTIFNIWEEYKRSHPEGYNKSQFYYHLRQNLVATKGSTTVLSNLYEPGQKLFIDFAGDTLSYIDCQTGEIVNVQVFVATMPYSDYAYATCIPSQKLEDFIHAVRMCLESLEGVPSIIVPDNLKSAVVKADRYEPKINKAFEDMGNHYGFAVLPARSAHPKDKALVENQVKLVYQRVFANLRNRQFYSLRELNEAVSELIRRHNQTRMQQRPYSREERFHATEKDKLQALPETIYEVKKYAFVTVSPSGEVLLSKDKHYYSVPYELIGRKASIIFTRSIVKIYVANKSVACHLRVRQFGHSISKEHLSPRSLAYIERSPAYYCNKARVVSPALECLFTTMFLNKQNGIINELYYRSCDKMLKLQKNTPIGIFEAACKVCIDNHLFKGESLENVINSIPITQQIEEANNNTDIVVNNHENTRGKYYFN